MPKYTVVINETLAHTAQVEADTPEMAVELAFDVIMNETGAYDTESLGTSTEPDVYEEN